jgi:hypothetical protein
MIKAGMDWWMSHESKVRWGAGAVISRAVSLAGVFLIFHRFELNATENRP